MSDSLPKDKDGNPVGKVVEVEYDVVDLPAWDFDKLVGGPVLRLTLGILKKMIEDAGEEFSEAMMPLREISDEGQKIELTKELLGFVDKALKAHSRCLDEKAVSEVLKTVFQDEEQEMIKSIFDEKYDIGVSDGKTELLLKILQKRFSKVPKSVEKAIRKMTDPIALDSYAEHALDCQSMGEFSQLIR